MMSFDVTHLIAAFIAGIVIGGGVTYKISARLKIGGGVSQRNINAGGDVVGGNKVEKK